MHVVRVQQRGADASAIAGALRVLERGPWFAAQDPSLKHEIVRRSTLRRFASRTLVYATGSPPGGVYFVLSGEVRLEQVARSGKFAFYQALRTGDMFGLLSEMDGTPRFSDARAWGATSLLHLPHAECQDLYRNHPAARDAFVAFICGHLHTALDMLVEEHSTPPRAQIANILVSLFSRDEDDRREMPKLTQEAIAAMAGVSRPTVSKVLHEFRELGLIALRYGQVAPLNIGRLLDIARA